MAKKGKHGERIEKAERDLTSRRRQLADAEAAFTDAEKKGRRKLEAAQERLTARLDKLKSRVERRLSEVANAEVRHASLVGGTSHDQPGVSVAAPSPTPATPQEVADTLTRIEAEASLDSDDVPIIVPPSAHASVDMEQT